MGLILVVCSLILLRFIGWKSSILLFAAGAILVLVIFNITMKTKPEMVLTESSWVSINNSNEPFLLYLYSDF